MKSDDLSRPVVEVRDFATKELEYEIYTFGEENVVIPVSGSAKTDESGLEKLAKETLYSKLRRWDPSMKIEFTGSNSVTLRVRNDVIPKIIGRKGKRIEEIEKEIGMRINIEPREGSMKGETKYEWEETGSGYYILVNPKLSGKSVDLYEDGKFLFSSIVGRKGKIKIRKNSEQGSAALQAHLSGRLRIHV